MSEIFAEYFTIERSFYNLKGKGSQGQKRGHRGILSRSYAGKADRRNRVEKAGGVLPGPPADAGLLGDDAPAGGALEERRPLLDAQAPEGGHPRAGPQGAPAARAARLRPAARGRRAGRIPDAPRG